MSRAGPLAAVVVAAGWLAGTPATHAQDVTNLLNQAAAYLAEYERSFSVVVSEEHYDQTTRRGVGAIVSTQRRALRSDVIVTNVGEDSWVAFRDVFEVDGKPVRDRDARLQRLFIETPSKAMAQGRRIMDESSRYNLGSLRRNINVPTMALTYVRGSNQRRSAFRAGPRDNVSGVAAETVLFTEQASPTVIRSASQDMPATGRFWIDPEQGRILKSELSVESKVSKSKITVTYAPVANLTVWAPVQMKEEYSTSTRETINAEAKYSNFRQFAVTVSEEMNAKAYQTIADAQLDARDYVAAEASARRALELDSKFAPAYTSLGNVLAATDRKAGAIVEWKKAVDLDKQALPALFNLTKTLAETGQGKDARTYGQRYLDAAKPASAHQRDIAAIKKILEGIK